MDSELFMLDEENGFSLILDKDTNEHWFVELIDVNQKVVFHYICDTFVTGNLVLHLKKAIDTFVKKRNKVVLSRWYPRVDARFLISIDGPTYISPYVYKDEETGNCNVKFIVTEETVEKPITFIIPLKQLQDKMF